MSIVAIVAGAQSLYDVRYLPGLVCIVVGTHFVLLGYPGWVGWSLVGAGTLGVAASALGVSPKRIRVGVCLAAALLLWSEVLEATLSGSW